MAGPADGAARREHMLGALRTAGFLSVTALARDLGVSDMTVRRDLRKLAVSGHVQVVHGGASLPPGALEASEFDTRADVSIEGKRHVALAARALVGEQDTIAVDAGTTTYQLAAALPEGFTGCVVTHSVPVIQLMMLRPSMRLVGLGGDLYRASGAFVGPMTVDAAARLRLRTFFLGAGAIDSRGVYVASDVERPTKQALMEIADNVVLLVDATKFSTSAPVQLCGLDRLDAVVTDRTPDTRLTAALRGAGARLILSGAQDDQAS